MAMEYDVVIVGSGVAGALCAVELSKQGRRKILILEAGDNGITGSQYVMFHQNMINQARYRDSMHGPYRTLKSRHYVPSPENSQTDLRSQINGGEKYYCYSEDTRQPFKAGYNRVVGGSTWSWRGNCPRLLPNDFKMQTNYRVARDWPLSYLELEPYYCRAERALGVSGDAREWQQLRYFRRENLGGHDSQWGFPMPPIQLSYSDEQIRQRIQGRTLSDGTKVQVVTTPQARNSMPYDGRPACEGLSTCIPLCSIQAKYNATVHLRLALAQGVTLRKGAVVTRLECGSNPRRVTTVKFKDWTSSDPQYEHEVRARNVVLAAHAIETPKILLASELANSSKQVGKNLMDHVQFELIALFPRALYPFRGPQSITSIEDYRDGSFRSESSAFRITIGNDGWGRTGSPASVLRTLTGEGKFGTTLRNTAADRLSRMVRLSLSAEMLPDPNNRVELSPDHKRDNLKLRRPMFTFDISPYTWQGLKRAEAVGRELMDIMGAKIDDLQKPLFDREKKMFNWSTGNHIMGTTVMGGSAADSVVDPYGRAHDLDNLWIVGSSVFPTAGTSNSTLTIAALTLRTAEDIERRALS